MSDTGSRTTASKWVYRITLAVFTLITIRFIRLARDLPDILPADAEGAPYWIAVTALISTPLPIALFTLALFFRSGASVWLFGLFAFQTIPNLIIPVLFSGISDRSQIYFLGFTLFAIAIPVTALVYLIQKQELRRP